MNFVGSNRDISAFVSIPRLALRIRQALRDSVFILEGEKKIPAIELRVIPRPVLNGSVHTIIIIMGPDLDGKITLQVSCGSCKLILRSYEFKDVEQQ